jgi:hypothetical protein
MTKIKILKRQRSPLSISDITCFSSLKLVKTMTQSTVITTFDNANRNASLFKQKLLHITGNYAELNSKKALWKYVSNERIKLKRPVQFLTKFFIQKFKLGRSTFALEVNSNSLTLWRWETKLHEKFRRICVLKRRDWSSIWSVYWNDLSNSVYFCW